MLALLADTEQPLRRIEIGLSQGQGQRTIQAMCADRMLDGRREAKQVKIRRNFLDEAILFHVFTSIQKLE